VENRENIDIPKEISETSPLKLDRNKITSSMSIKNINMKLNANSDPYRVKLL
jgi:hypothetical protein